MIKRLKIRDIIKKEKLLHYGYLLLVDFTLSCSLYSGVVENI